MPKKYKEISDSSVLEGMNVAIRELLHHAEDFEDHIEAREALAKKKGGGGGKVVLDYSCLRFGYSE